MQNQSNKLDRLHQSDIDTVAREYKSQGDSETDLLSYLMGKDVPALPTEGSGLQAATQDVVSEPVSSAATKQSWEMTQEEWDVKTSPIEPWKMKQTDFGVMQVTFQQAGLRVPSVVSLYAGSQTQHKYMIQQALSEGKPVPAEVLADYPDLAAKEKEPQEQRKQAEKRYQAALKAFKSAENTDDEAVFFQADAELTSARKALVSAEIKSPTYAETKRLNRELYHRNRGLD